MNDERAECVARRIELHLRTNQFWICHEILEQAEESERPFSGPRMPIALLPIDQHTVDLLDRAGMVYTDEVDLDSVKHLKGMGKTRLAELTVALNAIPGASCPGHTAGALAFAGTPTDSNATPRASYLEPVK